MTPFNSKSNHSSRNNRWSTLLLTLLFSSTVVHAQQFNFGTSQSPDGRRIEADSRGFVFDGHHVIPVMGEIHYSRVPEADWRNEIRKMKAGGITIISTYCFWNHHETTEGEWHWNGNRNLHQFLQVCKDEQMPVVLRIGPFCHGEVYQGGFPDWIVDKAVAQPKQYKLRTMAPGFLAATQRLYSNIYAQASDMLWKHGGPVVGVQIENECRGPWNYYMTLKQMAVSVGFDVPFYTRTGWPKLNGKETFGEMLPLYGDYADGFWDRNLTDMPGEYREAFVFKDTRMSRVIATETFTKEELEENVSGNGKKTSDNSVYPYLTCELGGGMTPAYHRRINMSGREALPLAICKVGSGSNLPGYYMYHGGTNPQPTTHSMAEMQHSRSTAHNDLPYMSYEFQSPLGEMGQVFAPSFHETRWFHQFLADWGEELSQMDVDTLSAHYARRGSFEFRNDYVRILHEEGRASVVPCGLKVGRVTVNTATVQPFAKADGQTYFVTIEGQKPSITIDGRRYSMKPNRPLTVKGETFVVLSPERAKAAFVIDGRMCYATNGGVLYRDQDGVCEEYWTHDMTDGVSIRKIQDAGVAREVKMGAAKVAEQPSDADFAAAEVYELTLADSIAHQTEGTFLSIDYAADCARVYCDGQLIEDNFWNGKPMLVRLTGASRYELRMLPLRKDAPIYLQKQQRAELEAEKGATLLKLKGVSVVKRCYARH